MIAFGVSLSDYERMDDETRFLLRSELRKVEARKRLDYICDVASLFETESRQHQLNLVLNGFDVDDDRRTDWLEALTRKA